MQVYLILWVALIPKSEGQDKPQTHCSNLTRGQESPGLASASGSFVSTVSVTGKVLLLLCRAPAKEDSAAVTTGQENKHLPSSPSTLPEPFMQPARTGTFAQHPISVNLIIFLNTLEEETPWKRSVRNLSIKRNLCLFQKNHSLFVSKIPDFLTYMRQTRESMCGINLFISGSSSR